MWLGLRDPHSFSCDETYPTGGTGTGYGVAAVAAAEGRAVVGVSERGLSGAVAATAFGRNQTYHA